MSVGPIRPAPTPLTEFFWAGCAESQLVILRCTACDFYVHLPRPVCPRCLCEELKPTQVSGRGVLYAYTTTMRAFDPFYVDKVPYVLAMVELVEQPGLKMTSQVIECAESALRVGLELSVKWVEVDETLTLPYFRPTNPAAAASTDRSSSR